MELKDYQVRTLDAFNKWLDALAVAREQSKTMASAIRQAGQPVPDGILNYPRTAWESLAQSDGVAESAGPYVDRTDDAGHPIPHVCFKVPTGGGKTLLAAAALERLGGQSGLVLWITPTRAIYEQTKAALRNREHPYRQMLERAGQIHGEGRSVNQRGCRQLPVRHAVESAGDEPQPQPRFSADVPRFWAISDAVP